MKKIWILLFLITLISFFLRIYKTNSIPPGLTWDEAALGYNSYSILKTGKDEYGQFMPLILKSFGDYKPALYSYLAIPFVGIFGLNEFSVRLPSVILGSLIPLLSYLLAIEFFGKQKFKIGLISAFLIMVSPWAIHFSRGAWEANVAFFEILLGLILLLKAEDNKKYFIASALIFALSIFTYQSSKIIALLLFFGTIFINKKALFKKENNLLSIILSIFLIIVFLFSISGTEVRSRLVYLNQLSYPRKESEVLSIKKEENGLTEFNFNVFHPEVLEYIKTVTSRYLNYFSPEFLFSQGAKDGRQGILDYGVMHLFEAVFLILGVIFFARLQFNARLKTLLLLFLISPIPAALSRDVTSNVRSLPLLFPLEMITALGVFYSLPFFLDKKSLRILSFFLIIGVIFNISYYLDRLFVHSKIDSAKYYLSGYKEAITFVKENQDKYDGIYFTTSYKEPYIFYLFYSDFDPQKYQGQAKLISLNPPDVGEVEKIDKINFTIVDWQKLRYTPNLLLIGSEKELPKSEINGSSQGRTLKTIITPDHEKETVFNIVETY